MRVLYMAFVVTFIVSIAHAQSPFDLGMRAHEDMERAVRAAIKAQAREDEARKRETARIADEEARKRALRQETERQKQLAPIKQQLAATATRHQKIENAAKKDVPALAQAECVRYFSITAKKGTPVKSICAEMVAKRDLEVTRFYALQYNDFIATVLEAGPGTAENITEACLTNANRPQGKADPGGLLTCLDLARNVDLTKLSKGEGDADSYFKLMKKADASTKPTAAFSAPAASDDPATRARVRQVITAECVKDASGYVQALCAGVAVHELFARDPYGDNGELAKVLSGVMTVYQVGNLPNQFIQQVSQNVLRQIGAPEAVVTFVTAPATIVTNPGTVAQQVHDVLPCIPSFFNGNKC